MARLFLQNCLTHANREAAARCPECRQFFCRECVAEHDGRLMCAGCLRELSAPETRRSIRWAGIGRGLAAGAGLVVLWFCFYALGQVLLSVPSDFHEGTVWRVNFWDSEP
jgi:hypothetical protein